MPDTTNAPKQTDPKLLWLLSFAGEKISDANGDTSTKPAPGGNNGGEENDDTFGDFFAFEKDNKEREAFLKDMRSKRDKIADTLKDGEWNAFNFSVDKNGFHVFDRKRKALDVSGTSENEADRHEWGDHIPEKNKEVIEKFREDLKELSEKMAEKRSEVTGNPLFTQKDIAAEIWAPLVRLRLAPETIVPTRYSEVAEILSQTNELYGEKVAEKKAAGKLTPKFDKRKFGVFVLQEALKSGKAIATVAMNEDTKELVVGIIEATSSMVSAGDEIFDSIKDKEWREVVATSCGLVADLVSSDLCETLCDANFGEEGKAHDAASLACKVFQGAFKTAEIATKISKSEGRSGQALLKNLGEAASTALSLSLGSVFGDKLDETVVAKIAKLKDGKWTKKEKEDFDGEDFIDEVTEWTNETMTSITESIKVSKFKMKTPDEIASELDRRTWEEDIENRKKTNALLAASDASSIDRLIAEIERDRKIFDTLVGIAKSGTALAGMLFDPLKPIANGVALVQNAKMAIERVSAVTKWKKTQASLAKAQSPLLSSTYNQVHNLTVQFTKHYTDTVLKGMEIVGQVMGLTPISAAGKIIEAVAKVGSSVANVVYKGYTAAELEKGWKATVKAFRNPKNRRLGLRARAKNPTLAKYTIAYGALEMKDPFACDLMRQIGLTEASLENKETDVHKVVSFLETLYNEDNQIYRECKSVFDGMPDVPELTIASWQQVVSALSKPARFAEETGTSKFSNVKSALIFLEALADEPALPDGVNWIDRANAMQKEVETSLNEWKKATGPEKEKLGEKLKEYESAAAKVRERALHLGYCLAGLQVKITDEDVCKKSKTKPKALEKNLSKMFLSLRKEAEGIAEHFQEVATAAKSESEQQSQALSSEDKLLYREVRTSAVAAPGDSASRPASAPATPPTDIAGKLEEASAAIKKINWSEFKKLTGLPAMKEVLRKRGKDVSVELKNLSEKIETLKKTLSQLLVKKNVETVKNSVKELDKLFRAYNDEILAKKNSGEKIKTSLLKSFDPSGFKEGHFKTEILTPMATAIAALEAVESALPK
ncbi:MAG: hypothetical protein LBS59_08215 [Puniceicoccales bacterium]|jgi:hypothetical protein|nr:hypothetical protein [Puniceicoccales bacterium]